MLWCITAVRWLLLLLWPPRLLFSNARSPLQKRFLFLQMNCSNSNFEPLDIFIHNFEFLFPVTVLHHMVHFPFTIVKHVRALRPPACSLYISLMALRSVSIVKAIFSDTPPLWQLSVIIMGVHLAFTGLSWTFELSLRCLRKFRRPLKRWTFSDYQAPCLADQDFWLLHRKSRSHIYQRRSICSSIFHCLHQAAWKFA